MSYRGRFIGVLALVLAVPVFGAAPAQSASGTSDNTIRVIQHNTDMHGPRPAMRAAADWRGVDAITFQELCKTQVTQLKNAGYTVFWSLQRERNATEDRCRKGNAIATPRTFGKLRSYKLLEALPGEPITNDKQRFFTLLCADLKGTGVKHTTVCTTHFPLGYDAGTTGKQNRITMANKVRRIVNAKIAKGRRVVLTGDFNAQPRMAPLDRFYRVKGTGRFWEGDQKCGKTKVCRDMAKTTSSGRKLDYFFVSSPGVKKVNGVWKKPVRRYDKKGHYVVLGSVNFRPLG